MDDDLILAALDAELAEHADPWEWVPNRCDEHDACVLDRRCPSFEVCQVVMDDRRRYTQGRRLFTGGDL